MNVQTIDEATGQFKVNIKIDYDFIPLGQPLDTSNIPNYYYVSQTGSDFSDLAVSLNKNQKFLLFQYLMLLDINQNITTFLHHLNSISQLTNLDEFVINKGNYWVLMASESVSSNNRYFYPILKIS